MASFLEFFLWCAFIISPSNSNTITSCAFGEPCIVNCIDRSCIYTNNTIINVGSATSVTINCEGVHACMGAVFTIENVPVNGPFILNCFGTHSCSGSKINARNAAEVTINCKGTYACYGLDLDCGSASECTLRCDYGYTYSCVDLVSFDCGISQCLMYCDAPLYSYSCLNSNASNAISPNTINAVSFECIGNGCVTEYINAFKSASPTTSTNSPTMIPSKSPSKSHSNISIPPTKVLTKSPSNAPTIHSTINQVLPTIITSSDSLSTSTLAQTIKLTAGKLGIDNTVDNNVLYIYILTGSAGLCVILSVLMFIIICLCKKNRTLTAKTSSLQMGRHKRFESDLSSINYSTVVNNYTSVNHQLPVINDVIAQNNLVDDALRVPLPDDQADYDNKEDEMYEVVEGENETELHM